MAAAIGPLAPSSSGRGSGMCSSSSSCSSSIFSSYLPVHIKRRSSFSGPLCASFGFLPSRILIYNVTERKERSVSCCSRVELADEVVSFEKDGSEARLANGDADIINNVDSQEMIGTDLQREQKSLLAWLYPDKEELPDDKEMSIFDHLEELRQRVFISVVAVGVAILGCFAYSKTLVSILESPAFSHGVRFLQLSPGEYFFTTVKVSGYCGILVGSPVILYEIIAFVLPGLTRNERRFLAPIVFGSSILFYSGLLFSYAVLTPAALNFFVEYSEGVVESLWSIDRYFEFILVLMFGTGLSFQVPVIQLMLGQTRIVTGDQMLSIWRFVVLGAVIAAAVITPSTDPLTQVLLAGPLVGLYLGGALLVKFLQPKDSD